MDLLRIIDRLDDLVHNAKPVPLTDQVRLNKDEVFDMLDQMRATLPEEIRQARSIITQRESSADAPGEAASATPISVEEAEADFSGLVHRAKFGGEAFVVELAGVPMARVESA